MIYTKDMIKKKMKQKERRNKVIKILYIPIILLVILGAMSIIFQKVIEKQNHADILGYKTFIVLTGSMEPNIKVGDMVFVKQADENDLKEGDIITYSINNTKKTVTHRITKIVEENGIKTYRTKGDNNNAEDSEIIEYKNIVGKMSFKISKIGGILSKIVTTGGIAVIVLIALISWSYSSRKTNRVLAREEARKKYNFRKYKDNEEDVNDSI